MSEMMLFAGNANKDLAHSIASHLNMPLSKATVGRFSDGEVMIEILENVRGRNVFIIQPTCAPTNDNLMELIVMADALRRASARKITAVVPYYGYARQDRRVRSARVPISAKIVADMFSIVGISRVITVDLHADQIQGFFSSAVDNVYATPVMLSDLRKKFTDLNDVMVVSPDVGGVVRARAIAKKLNDRDLAIIDKRRTGPNKSQVMHIIGEVKDKHCLIVDDIVDTAGTICSAANSLKEQGALSVSCYVTHPVLSGKAIENITNSGVDEMVVCDSIPLSDAAKSCTKIRIISLAEMLAKTIQRVNEEQSVSLMFEDD